MDNRTDNNKDDIIDNKETEMEENTLEEEAGARRRKNMNYLRILVSVYLLYISFDLTRNVFAGKEGTSPFMLIAVVIFVVFAIVFVVISVKDLNTLAKAERENSDKNSREDE